MRWIALFSLAIVTGVARWNVKTISEPAMSLGIDPFELMLNAKNDLPVQHWQRRDHLGETHPSAH
jgi:hypothetical protein